MSSRKHWSVDAISNCTGCGRDTLRRSRLCKQCSGDYPKPLDEGSEVGKDETPSTEETINGFILDAIRDMTE